MTTTRAKLTALLAAASIAASLTACLVGEGASEDTPSAAELREVRAAAQRSTLFHSGTIYLGDATWTSVEALLVCDGRVVASGKLADLERQPHADLWTRENLAGATALPGLQDAHGHVENLGAALESLDLRGVASYAALLERVAALASEMPPGTWIEGRGWDQNLWEGGVFPHHRRLSEAVPDHPVILERVDGHAILVNAAALELAGLTGVLDPPPAPEGGAVLLDGEGHATGVLIDNAADLVVRRRPPPDRETRRRRILRAQDALLAVGLTAVHDMGVDLETLEVLVELRYEGELRLRLIEYFMGNDGIADAVAWGLPLAPDELDRLAVIGVKLVVDGALGSRGAALLEDYSDDPGNRGLPYFDEPEYLELVRACARAGLQPATHAIGDRGNRMVLDTYERVAAEEPRFAALRPRLEHVQIVAPGDWARVADGRWIASMQPTHATSDMPWAPARLGPERLAGAYAWRRLAPDPAYLAFGSDFPVERPDPLEGIYAAMTRQDRSGEPPGGWLRDQCLGAAEALAAFTSGAARAAHQEDRRGRLLPGYFADMTVIDVDPFEVPPQALLQARVVSTWIDGEPVHRAPPR